MARTRCLGLVYVQSNSCAARVDLGGMPPCRSPRISFSTPARGGFARIPGHGTVRLVRSVRVRVFLGVVRLGVLGGGADGDRVRTHGSSSAHLAVGSGARHVTLSETRSASTSGAVNDLGSIE